MSKEKRRNWLDKISRWIFEALPADKAAAPFVHEKTPDTSKLENQQQPQKPSSPSLQPLKEARGLSDSKNNDVPRPAWNHSEKNVLSKTNAATNEDPLQVVQLQTNNRTINNAWKAFELAWANAGLSDHYFLVQEELNSTLEVLDRSFEEELIEWLFKLCTKPEALKDLSGILERGKVKPTDNIDAIRAFAYVSIAVKTTPRQATVPRTPDLKPAAAPATSVQQSELEAESKISSRNLAHSNLFTKITEEPETNSEQASLDSRIEKDNVVKSDLLITKSCEKNVPLTNLELSIRSYNCLRRSNIHTLLDLAGHTDESLIQIKNFGSKSVDEVRQALKRRGLDLPFQSEDVLGQASTNPNTDRQLGNHSEDSNNQISTLGLSNRTLNCLYRINIKTIPQLCNNSEKELAAVRNLGQIAIQEIKDVLTKNGLSLLEEGASREEETKKKLEDQQSSHNLEEAWQDLKLQEVNQVSLASLDLEDLIVFCEREPNDSARQCLADILTRLKATLEFIDDRLSKQNPVQQEIIKSSINALRNYIPSKLLEQSSSGALQWVNQITNSFSPNQERNWLVYLLRCGGQTLVSIGDAQNPPVSRERVRQMDAKVSKLVGIKSSDLAEQEKNLLETKKQIEEKEGIQKWLQKLGRLPINSDPREKNSDRSDFWNDICEMDLKSRSELLVKHELMIPEEEFDYHYEYVANQFGQVGSGYWRQFEYLKQFILRHAIALGEASLMPKQTSFPDTVRGVVTRYGGQSKVAKRIGLQYQGQLVGSDGGRRYWTDERLNLLLKDTNELHQNNIEAMPSYGQVLEFFSKTDICEYNHKKAHSAISALTKQGSLHWSEVAQRFDKSFISGESQKSVTLGYIKAFVRDLGEHLDSLSPSELFVLFQAQGINRGEKEKFSRTFDALVDAVQSGVVDKDELRSWAENNEVESIDELIELGAELKEESTIEDKEQKLLERRSRKLMDEFPQKQGESEIQITDLPSLEPVKILKALDKAAEIVDNSANDSDKVEFLKAKAAAKLWDSCFLDEQGLISKLRAFPADIDSYSEEVQQAFIDEYEGAKALPIPDTYSFRDLKGKPRNPKLMQRLVAFRLERDFRLLNLSGTGTGKTLSAIYAAQICGCQRLLISCPNGVIESWRRAFSSAFPTANLIIKPEGWELNNVIDGVNVVIVNHERFQDRFAQQLLGFCINYQADMIVIDEIHQSKQRSSDKSSQRRKLLNEFIRISSNINTDIRVLGLSATPVINNLYEGRSLIELICQETIDGVSEKVDLNSCMNLYQQFVVHGIRMNPGQLSRTKLIHRDIDVTSLLPQIVLATKKGNYHDIEQLLVAPKIASLGHCLVRGKKAVIFVTYIKNTLRPITNWLSENNYSFSVYTGDEKEAQEEGYKDSLDEFIHGNSEVLVASVKCVGTGVDGLQSVCNRAVFFQLPWTSTEFEQTIGRLDRDGTDFDSVNVYLPMTDVSLPNGDRWSWCRSKLDRIESKRDIAKAAVDGEIPDAATLISPSEASRYWVNWLEKLDQQQSSGTE